MWVSRLLPSDKAERYKQLFTWPHQTSTECERAFEQLEKVLEGVNPVFDLTCSTPEAKGAAMSVLNSLGGRKAYEKELFDYVRCNPGSFQVVDLPREQNDTYPTPYYYFLSIDNVIDFDWNDKGHVTYIIFEQPGGFAVIDESSYWFFECEGKDYLNYTDLFETPHRLNRCPANFLSSKAISKRKPYLRVNAISAYLGALNWLLFFSMCERHTDLTSGFPVEWFYEADKDEQEKEEMDREKGVMPIGYYRVDRNGTVQYPGVNIHETSGPGGVIDVPLPDAEEGMPDLSPPGGTIERNIEAVKYVEEKFKKLKAYFLEQVTGYAGEPINNQAKNEKQVGSIYETRKNALNVLARQMEKSEKWMLKTLFELTVGDRFLELSVSMGTDFFLEDVQTIEESLLKLKSGNASLILIEQKESQLNRTKYRNNEEVLERMDLLSHLEPFRHSTKAELKDMLNMGLIQRADFVFKANFISLLQRFERENGPVEQFGINIALPDDSLALHTRIEIIKEAIYSYINESLPELQTAPIAQNIE